MSFAMSEEDTDRFLVYSDDAASKIDYNILAVAAFTLALILLVEVIRNSFDHLAYNRPFFLAVLEGVYRECTSAVIFLRPASASSHSIVVTTLGFVEFLLFLVAEYYPEHSKERKAAFGAVHFALFETAIFNAFMSACTAFVTMKVSHRLWVETEHLEVNHYVEIREEFDRIDENNRKYQTLLVQIKFHQLRVQFIKSYNLPLQLKISDYLIRCEREVLIKLVDISSTAWLLLTGALSLLYYICGIVYYETRDQQLLGQILAIIYFATITLFIIISLALSHKMHSIFRTILKEKWVLAEGEEKERLVAAQLDLFWGSDPKHVIRIIQSMQFGYAIAIAIAIIFWKEIGEGPIPSYIYLLAVLVCYSIFVVITGRVIPQYTLCTSLGQLVDESRLRETVALFELEEAKRNQMEFIECGDEGNSQDYAEASPKRDDLPVGKPFETVKDNKKADEVLSHDDDAAVCELQVRMDRRRKRFKSVSDGVALMAMRHSPIDTKGQNTTRNSRINIRAELVTLDTSTLRSIVTETAEERKRSHERLRNNRRKAMSTGVGTMAMMDDTIDRLNGLNDDRERNQEKIEERRQSYQKLLRYGREMSSAGVTAMIKPIKEITSASPVGFVRNSHDTRSTNAGRGPIPVGEICPGRCDGRIDDGRKSNSRSEGTPSLFPAGNSGQKLRVLFDQENEELWNTTTGDGYVSDGDNLQPFPRLPAAKRLPTFRERVNEFLLSPRYVFLSNLFGTIAAFLLIGERVEGFKQSQRYASEDFVSLAMPRVLSFWILVGWISSCLSASLLLVYFFWRKTSRSFDELTALLAAAIDATLFVTCGTFLLIGVRLLEVEDVFDDPAEQCRCSHFGSRLYGGLGNIEPFISLVCLRIFRHWIANVLVVRIFGQKRPCGEESSNVDLATATKMNLESGSVLGVNSGLDEKWKLKKCHILQAKHQLVLAEVWEQTLRDNPDIVQTYGAFSGEILRSMLGVKENDDDEKREGTKISSERETSNNTIPIPNPVGDEDQNWDSVWQNSQVIAFPKARLVRSMQRCERKLLPILDNWTVVDVALTRFEIVYFDASDADHSLSHQDTLLEITRNWFGLTKGGKGLRLAEAAKGRRLVGRMLLEEIVTVFVERYLHGSSPIDSPAVEGIKKHDQTTTVFDLSARRWGFEVQDQLQVTTSSGQTLCLRFYSDMEDAMTRRSHDEYGKSTRKNNAISWALTIVRFCGPEQLKQALLSIGQDDDAEIRELLHINSHRAEAMPNWRSEGRLRGLSYSSRPSRRSVMRRSNSLPFSRHTRPFTNTESNNSNRMDSTLFPLQFIKKTRPFDQAHDIENGST